MRRVRWLVTLRLGKSTQHLPARGCLYAIVHRRDTPHARIHLALDCLQIVKSKLVMRLYTSALSAHQK